ncbi:type III secretion system protein SsaT, partial [Salmonella enterica subsp. enterica serovar Heidelberg str. RI-11-014316]
KIYPGRVENALSIMHQLLSPAIICMVLADLALGLLNRSAQQLNVFFFSMPLKSILVLLTLLISFPYALHHYLVESDKFYIYLKDWFPSV